MFAKDALALAKQQRDICTKLHFEALHPFDNEPGLSAGDTEKWMVVFQGNVQQLEASDVVILDLNDFPLRGGGVDDGTAWECGYAVARGKTVRAFRGDAAAFGPEMTTGLGCKQDADGHWLTPSGHIVPSDYGLPLNLMLAGALAGQDGKLSWLTTGSFEDCVQALRNDIDAGNVPHLTAIEI